MEVVREKSLSPELRQKNPERSEVKGERMRGWEGGGNLERLRGWETERLREWEADGAERLIY